MIKSAQFIFRILVSAIIATLSYKLLVEHDAALEATITILSIFIGFNLTILTLLTDQIMRSDASFSEAINTQTELKNKFRNYHKTFNLYLTALILAFLVLLHPTQKFKVLQFDINIELALSWLCSISFAYSILLTAKLPTEIIRFQLKRHGKLIDEKAPKLKSANKSDN